MAIEVQLFGPQAQLAGKRTVRVETPRGTLSAGDLLAILSESEPVLAESIPLSRIAVNHEFAAPDQQINAGDEVALIGMVSGG